MQLNINTDACIVMTNKLEKLHKSALPSAIRGTLNRAAFDVKKDTLLKYADAAFIKRQPNFFRVFSRVDIAKGFNVNIMQATIGMTTKGLNGSNNYAVDDLKQQEDGGDIRGRSFIPYPAARVSGNIKKNVKPANRLRNIKKIISAKNNNVKTAKGRFLRSVFSANAGGYVLSEKTKGKQVLWRIDSISSSARHKRLIIKKTPLYSYDAHRSVQVKANHFMRNASMESANKIDGFYNEEAKRQIERLMGK